MTAYLQPRFPDSYRKRHAISYFTQNVGVFEEVTVVLNASCNLLTVASNGSGFVRLYKLDGTTVLFAASYGSGNDARVIIPANTPTAKIVNNGASTIEVTQLAVWGDFS